MNDLAVAKTILSQMGGAGRLDTMIGADAFLGDTDSLTFAFRGCRTANKCRITLDALDTYRVEFFSIRRNRKTYMIDCNTVAEFGGVYADDLVRVFERTTGLYLSL